MPEEFDSLLRTRLDQKALRGILRRLPTRRPGLTDFASNDYLGLARSEELRLRIEQEFRSKFALNGSTGSRLLTGNDEYIEEVEAELAAIFSSESTLIFNSGYAANLAVLSCLPQKGDTIIYDELSHASIKDGARLSLARHFSFAHNDTIDLEKKIHAASGRVFIAIESVYSMDGDVCPLKEIIAVAHRYGGVIILDEAHSTGLTGKDGGGLAMELGVSEKISVRIFTFGKALGIHGACVAGSATLKDYLINFARQFIYTTAPDRYSVASIRCAFAFLKEHPDLQTGLRRNIKLFLSETEGFKNRTQSSSAIQTLIIPGAENVRSAARMIQDDGMDVRPIVSPTVPEGSERLRICLHSFNTSAEIEKLTSILKVYARHA